MTSQMLKKNQPIVWRMMRNALRGKKLAHAYLFAGDKSAGKSEAALLFAKSIVCEHPDEDGFACGSCLACQRIENRSSADFAFLEKEELKRKNIVALQEKFASTALGSQMERVYILEDFDKARNDAANALLKFLEEPQPGIHAILTCTQKSNVLPTILSRTQVMSFRPEADAQRKEMEELVDPESALLFSECGYSLEKVKGWIETNAEFLQEIKTRAAQYLPGCQDEYQIYLMQRLFPSKGEHTTRQWILLWLEWVLYGVKNTESPYSMQTRIKMQIALVETIDLLEKNVDLCLLLDSFYYEMRKAVSENEPS